jgi:hypothetical protein
MPKNLADRRQVFDTGDNPELAAAIGQVSMSTRLIEKVRLGTSREAGLGHA